MPYIHKFTKELEQFGLCSFRLNLSDPDLILPELNIPVVFRSGEDTEEAMTQLATRMIQEQTELFLQSLVAEQPVTEVQPVSDEFQI